MVATQPSTVLFLAANPMCVKPLQLGEECRTIENKIQAAKYRDRIRFRSRWAARPDDLLQALNEDAPSVLHFSGHGFGEKGLCFQAENGSALSVSTHGLKQIIQAAGDGVAVVVLNACFSEVQAQALVAHVPCVIGMTDVIGDTAAIVYAGAFYSALAFGRSVANAHEQGLAALSLCSATGRTRDAQSDEDSRCSPIPELLTRSDIDACRIYIVNEQACRRSCELRIKATLKEFDPDVIARVTETLRQITGDLTLEITDIREGSVRLTLSLTPAALERLMRLRAEGQLEEIHGFQVSDLASPPMSTPSSEPHLPHISQMMLGGACEVTSVEHRGRRCRLPYILGTIVLAGAAAAIAVVLAVDGSEPAPALRGTRILDESSPKAERGSGSGAATAREDTTFEIDDPAPAFDVVGPAPPLPVDIQVLAPPAGALEAECRGLQDVRKWDELAQCAARLEPTNPQLAAGLEVRAAEEATLARRIAAFEAALRKKDLRRAKTELDQISMMSLEYPRIKKLYAFAEAQAIRELAAELARVKDLDCEEYEELLVKERAAQPARVIDGATRKTSCTKCDADALVQKAKDELAKRRYTASLEAYDASLRCRPAASVAREAFTVACENNARAKAKVFWKLLPSATRAKAKDACVQNGITVAELDAP